MSAAYDIAQQFDPLLTEIEAAQLRKQSVRTLQAERHRGGGCSFIKLGRSVRYRRSDVLRFIESHVKKRETRAAWERENQARAQARKERAAEAVRKLCGRLDYDGIALLKEIFTEDLMWEVYSLLHNSNLERAA
jgi:hypothetical protein